MAKLTLKQVRRDRAEAVLGPIIRPEGSLISNAPYIHWTPISGPLLALDGGFSVKTLQAIVWWIESFPDEDERGEPEAEEDTRS